MFGDDDVEQGGHFEVTTLFNIIITEHNHRPEVESGIPYVG